MFLIRERSARLPSQIVDAESPEREEREIVMQQAALRSPLRNRLAAAAAAAAAVTEGGARSQLELIRGYLATFMDARAEPGRYLKEREAEEGGEERLLSFGAIPNAMTAREPKE